MNGVTSLVVVKLPNSGEGFKKHKGKQEYVIIHAGYIPTSPADA